MSTPFYKALDFSLIFVACAVAYWLRFGTVSLPLYYLLPTTIFAVVSLLSLQITNFYQPSNSFDVVQRIIAAGSGLSFSAILTVACLFLTKTGEDYSRIWFVTAVLIAITGLVTSRSIITRIFSISVPPRVIILLGGGKSADRVVENLKAGNDGGISIAKQFNLRETQNLSLSDVAMYIEDCRRGVCDEHPITEVWITHDVFKHFSHADLTVSFDNSSVRLVYIPEYPELTLFGENRVSTIAGILTINSDFTKHQKLNQLIKFIEDQMVAWTSLIVFSPILAVVAIAIKLESKGPVFYRQIRYGFGGREFQIWKFRTMYTCEESSEFKQATKNDPRVTKVGKFLRRSSIDELPQLINVINGSMSIVGPRPHPVELNEQYRLDIRQYMFRHAIKPGITGLAQVKGFRGETVDPKLMQQRINYDLEYVQNWSIFLDIKIILMTITHIAVTQRAH